MLDEIATRALEDDKAWWPFVHARPRPREDVPPALCVKIAAVHALIATACAALLTGIESHATRLRFVSALPWFSLVVFAGVFALARFGLAHAWNARARRLRGERHPGT